MNPSPVKWFDQHEGTRLQDPAARANLYPHRYQVIIRGGSLVPRAAITILAETPEHAEDMVSEWARLMDPTAYVDETFELA